MKDAMNTGMTEAELETARARRRDFLRAQGDDTSAARVRQALREALASQAREWEDESDPVTVWFYRLLHAAAEGAARERGVAVLPERWSELLKDGPDVLYPRSQVWRELAECLAPLARSLPPELAKPLTLIDFERLPRDRVGRDLALADSELAARLAKARSAIRARVAAIVSLD